MEHNLAISDAVRHMASDCVAVRVRMINRVISAIYDEALRPHRIRISQLNILVIAARLAEARPADVAKRLRLEKSTLSRDVEVMKREGWIETDPPSGGRNQKLRVSHAGLELLGRCLPAWEKAQAEAAKLIAPPDLDVLRRLGDTLGLRAPEA